MELKISKENEVQKLNQVSYVTEKAVKANALELVTMRKDHDLDNVEKELKIENDCYTAPVLKSMVLDTTKDIYSKLSISGMKVVNLNGAKGEDG